MTTFLWRLFRRFRRPAAAAVPVETVTFPPRGTALTAPPRDPVLTLPARGTTFTIPPR